MKKNKIGLWAKEIGGAAVAGLLVLVAGLQDDGNLSLAEGSAAASAFLAGVLLTSFVKNVTTGFWVYGKAVVQGAIGALASFGSAVSDGDGWPPSMMEWLLIIIAALAAAGITSITSNARNSDADQFKDNTTPDYNAPLNDSNRF